MYLLPVLVFAFCCVLGEVDGVSVPGERLNGEVECVRGEWRVDSAAVVAPGFEEDVMARGCVDEEGVAVLVVCEGWEVDGEEAFPCWMAECALNAARKLAKKGRWVGIVGCVVLFCCSSGVRREYVEGRFERRW
jgi:hypothetical protein